MIADSRSESGINESSESSLVPGMHVKREAQRRLPVAAQRTPPTQEPSHAPPDSLSTQSGWLAATGDVRAAEGSGTAGRGSADRFSDCSAVPMTDRTRHVLTPAKTKIGTSVAPAKMASQAAELDEPYMDAKASLGSAPIASAEEL